ncbi:hypothetical protein J9303_00810 [Bacillaceae bacterium Marseille-Q3522]|nr:hypothetical protein [Bacillaceae bacterium Marseille-Q3522]
MKKDITHHIAFYVRKVAERGSVHPSKVLPRRYKYRGDRLKLYKKLLHAAIVESGYKVK